MKAKYKLAIIAFFAVIFTINAVDSVIGGYLAGMSSSYLFGSSIIPALLWFGVYYFQSEYRKEKKKLITK